jgi:hypothetical protein
MKENVMNKVKTSSKQKKMRRGLIAAGIVAIITLSDKSIKMQGFNLKFTRVVRMGDKVKIYVDMGYDINAPENLSEATLAGSFDYSAPLKENITTDYYEFEVKPDWKELKLKFSEMYTILKGSWSFEIPGE